MLRVAKWLPRAALPIALSLISPAFSIDESPQDKPPAALGWRAQIEATTRDAVVLARTSVVSATQDTHKAVKDVGLATHAAAGSIAVEAARKTAETYDAAVNSDVAVVSVALTKWAAAQPFDSSPYAADTLQALRLAGFESEPSLGRVFTKPNAAGRIVRLPRDLRSGESFEAIVTATVTEAGVVITYEVPSTGVSRKATVPVETAAVSVPGLSINAFGWADLGLAVACKVLPSPPPEEEGLSLVVRVSLGASLYGLGKTGVPLCNFTIPLHNVGGFSVALSDTFRSSSAMATGAVLARGEKAESPAAELPRGLNGSSGAGDAAAAPSIDAAAAVLVGDAIASGSLVGSAAREVV